MPNLESPTTQVLDLDAGQDAEWLSWSRMADFVDTEPPVYVGGDGPYISDSKGNRYFDGVSGLFTTQVGYSFGKEFATAAATQLEQLGFYPNWAATNPTTLALNDRVLGVAPENMERIYFTSGGSEAVESAMKLIRQHFLALDQPARRKFIARRGAYHGCTYGALSLTGIASARGPFEPLLPDVRHVDNTDRRNWPGLDDDAYTQASVAAFERVLLAEGPETVAAVVVEPVQNAGGCLVPPPGYGAALRELCDRHGVLLWCDEVITGFGRLGEWFGSSRLGFGPDVITFAKGITSGYAPLGGALFSSAIAASFLGSKDVYMHGHTFGGHPLACAIALRNLDLLESEDVFANVHANESYLHERLQAVVADAPAAVDTRGLGYFHSIELRDAATAAQAGAAIRKHGVIVRVDVRVNPCLAISPPLISSRADIDALTQGIATGLADIG
jgi:adenosylmethionine-8-amino-7-oxononanoate aminotransferase